MKCPICDKPYKGKIGVGVHLKKGHTSAERSKLFMARITGALRVCIVILYAVGISQMVEKERLEHES